MMCQKPSGNASYFAVCTGYYVQYLPYNLVWSALEPQKYVLMTYYSTTFQDSKAQLNSPDHLRHRCDCFSGIPKLKMTTSNNLLQKLLPRPVHSYRNERETRQYSESDLQCIAVKHSIHLSGQSMTTKQVQTH